MLGGFNDYIQETNSVFTLGTSYQLQRQSALTGWTNEFDSFDLPRVQNMAMIAVNNDPNGIYRIVEDPSMKVLWSNNKEEAPRVIISDDLGDNHYAGIGGNLGGAGRR